MPYQSESVPATELFVKLPGTGQVKLELKWRVLHGRAEVVALSLSTVNGTTPLEPVALRKLPLASIIRSERSSAVRPRLAEHGTSPGTRRARQILSDVDLKHVSELYMAAWQQGIPVQRHVAEHRDVAISTAARQILLARKRGFISKEINPPRRRHDGKNYTI